MQSFHSFNINPPVINYYSNSSVSYGAPFSAVQNIQNPLNSGNIDYYSGQKPDKKRNTTLFIFLTLAAAAVLGCTFNFNKLKKLLNSTPVPKTTPPAPKKVPKKTPKKLPKNGAKNSPSNPPAPSAVVSSLVQKVSKPRVQSPKTPSVTRLGPSKTFKIKQVTVNGSSDTPKTSARSRFNIQRQSPVLPEPLANKAIKGILSRDSLNRTDLKQIEDIFKQHTGINLYCPEPHDIGAFEAFFDLIFNGKFCRRLDSEIKHIIIGHGTGSSVDGSWRFLGTSRSVFDFIENNIPKGEKVLLITCEEAQNAIKPGLGTPVNIALLDRAEPGKVVESGKRAIIGTLTQFNPKIEYFEGFAPSIHPQNSLQNTRNALRKFTDENPEIVANTLVDLLHGGDGFGI